jgi:hypothetical protein
MSGLLRIGATLLWLACACENADRASEPVWNKQPCAHCHMLLSDPRYAAQVALDDGQRFFFDDVGCLAVYVAGNEKAVRHAWVDQGSVWRDAYATRYAQGATTPMGYGFAADPRGSVDFAFVVRTVSSKRAEGTAP